MFVGGLMRLWWRSAFTAALSLPGWHLRQSAVFRPRLAVEVAHFSVPLLPDPPPDQLPELLLEYDELLDPSLDQAAAADATAPTARSNAPAATRIDFPVFHLFVVKPRYVLSPMPPPFAANVFNSERKIISD
ncbi:MAG: hypothetical protein ED859_15640 [Desulfuromonadales bacterium]|nr:MAG: hypothetical protein ED859_15640 [Desulfuromonadales bacterium]